MEEEPKPKQPCKTCGPPTAWNPQQTRRDLFKSAVIAGVGITALLSSSQAEAYDMDDDADRRKRAWGRYDAVDDSIKAGRMSKSAKSLAHTANWAIYIEDLALCSAELLTATLLAAAEYALEHPFTPSGAIIIIFGTSFICIGFGVLILA